MELNMDCVRDILLTVEKELPPGRSTNVILLTEHLQKYSQEEIAYSCLLLTKEGYLDGSVTILQDSVGSTIKSLTWKGHSFLENIKNDTAWNNAKSKISKTVGNASIEIVSSVSSSIIQKMLGL